MRKVYDFLWLLLEAVLYRVPFYLWQIATGKRPGPFSVAKSKAGATKARAIAKVEPSLPLVAGFGMALLLPPIMTAVQVVATCIACGIFPQKVQRWGVGVAFVGCILLTDDAVGEEWTPLLRHIIGWF